MIHVTPFLLLFHSSSIPFSSLLIISILYHFFHLFPAAAGATVYTCFCYHQKEQSSPFARKNYAKKTKKNFIQSREEPAVAKVAKKKGTIAGAVALVIGTTIGSGILALPQKASPAVLSLSYSFKYFVF